MHILWQDMLVPGVPILEKIIRPLLVYAFLVVGLRLAGKRELAQLNPFDLVVLLTLSNTVQNAIIGNDNSVAGGLIGAATLLIANYLVVRFLFKHERLDKIIEGEPDVLIENGILCEERLKQELMTRHELETAAHRQGFSSLEDIERAVFEPGGTIFFVGNKPPREETMQLEVLSRLDTLKQEISELRSLVRAQQ